jgi:hypothetical protein
MRERPAPVTAAALRLAGHVGQTALERIPADGAAALAQLDQHIAAVRADLGASQRYPAGSAEAACPDVPFVPDALIPEPVVPAGLLLHYACGLVEGALRSDWQPAVSAGSRDWASMRLAAICHLIRQAEAAAELHPDLRDLRSS